MDKTDLLDLDELSEDLKNKCIELEFRINECHKAVLPIHTRIKELLSLVEDIKNANNAK